MTTPVAPSRTAPLEPETGTPPWMPPPDPNTTIATTLHILADAPIVRFGSETYPSLDILVVKGDGTHANFYVTVTGDKDQRAAFATALRNVADQFSDWDPEGAS